MKVHDLSLQVPVKLELTGKFQAPHDTWKHMDRVLLDYELIVMTEGTFYLQVDQTQYAVKKGEYLLLSPSSRTFGYKESGCSFYWMHFIPQILSGTIMVGQRHNVDLVLYGNAAGAKEIKDPIGFPEHAMIENSEKIVLIMKQLHDAMRHHNTRCLNDYFATTLLLELFCQITLNQEESAISSSHKKKITVYNDIIDYIKWKEHERVTVSEIADHFGYNEKYLSHLFSSLAGMPLKQYILKQTMELAKFHLSDKNHSIKEIASILGYSDSHHFMKTFKKVVGLTPTEYRNTYAQRLLYYK